MKRHLITVLLLLFASSGFAGQNYTVLSKKDYQQTVADARQTVKELISILKPYRAKSLNAQVAFLVQELTDIPYIHANGMGEGDWQPTASVYKPGAPHVTQNPVYRFDGLNCQTLVQVVMALLHANNLAQFDQNLVKIAYGAAGNPQSEIVRYYNRNNFIDADFNPINQQNGWLEDVTAQGNLASATKKATATITRQRWFDLQRHQLTKNVRVLSADNGPDMAERFTNFYAHLPFKKFTSEKITIRYIPKELLVTRNSANQFTPNQALLDKIPTPAIAEIVRDPRKWRHNGYKVKDLIGSETSISHLGLLYRQTFENGALIYSKTTCERNTAGQKICRVTPVTCAKEQCHELMFAHSTDALPIGYYWYQKPNGDFYCSPERPPRGTEFSSCNRVVQTTLFDYLTDYQLGGYWNMELRSILGVHVEQIH